MTEELEKEAEEYTKEHWSKNVTTLYSTRCIQRVEGAPYFYTVNLREAYLAGAEPREKQIEIDAEQIRALQKQNGELTDKVKELEAQIEKMKCCENCAFFKDKTYDICHRIKKLGTRKCAFYKMI